MNISASPYHRGKGAQRERMLVQRARDNLAYVVVLQPRRRPGRARLRRLQPGRRPGRRAGRARRPVRGGADRLRHRPLDGRRAPACATPATVPPRGCGARRSPTLGAARGAGAPRRDRGRRPAREAARARRGGLRGALPRAARLRRQERLRAGAARPLGRDRLRAHGLRRGRRARRRAGRVRGDALPPLLRGDPAATPARWRDNLGIERFELRARAADAGLRRGARGARSRAPSRASPRRTSRPASAATC